MQKRAEMAEMVVLYSFTEQPGPFMFRNDYPSCKYSPDNHDTSLLLGGCQGQSVPCLGSSANICGQPVCDEVHHAVLW